jgi:LytS/YehU family sensor histidine kinase
MMNTLVSIISLISESPKKAVRLIKTLAAEFRLINRISAQSLIPLREEIRLCRMHLELMGYRMDAEYEFVEHSVCDEQTIPPMILHTLVENGLTHAYGVGQNGSFALTSTKNRSGVQYRLRNNGPLLQELAARSEPEIEEGMGMKYVRARLEESYPSRWELEYGLNGTHWEVCITIKT